MSAEALLHRKRLRTFGDYPVQGRTGLEIGPLSRPLVRREDSRVFYMDVESTEALRQKYRDTPDVDVDAIVDVDFLWSREPIHRIVGDKAPLDYVVASHVIEHVPNLIGWLDEIRETLKPGGRLVLVVPDKRFTFDVFRRTTPYWQVAEAHREARTRPDLRTILDCFGAAVTVNTHEVWEDYRAIHAAPFSHDNALLDVAQRHYAEGQYIDVHCWVFTPWSFMETLGAINEDRGLGFDLRYFLTTQSHDLEFYVQLERVETSTTDWAAASEDARLKALWPKDAAEVRTGPDTNLWSRVRSRLQASLRS